MKKLLIATLGLFAAACAYPVTQVGQGAAASTIYFAAIPPDAEVFVDGVSRGPAAGFDGSKSVLQVTPGRHVVEIRSAGAVVLKRDVFVAEGSRLKVD